MFVRVIFSLVAFFAIFVPAISQDVRLPALVRQNIPALSDFSEKPPALGAPYMGNPDNSGIVTTPRSRRGKLGDWFVRWGVLRPKYEVDLNVDFESSDFFKKYGESFRENESGGKFEFEWEFSEEYYFSEPPVKKRAVKVVAWSSFPVTVRVTDSDGDTVVAWEKWVQIPPPE